MDIVSDVRRLFKPRSGCRRERGDSAMTDGRYVEKRYIEERYILAYRNELIGTYYVFDDGSVSYEAYHYIPDHIRDELKQDGLSENIGRNIRQKGHIPFFDDLMKETNRVQGRKRVIYESGPVRMMRVPQETGKRFMVYRRSAQKGEKGYSPKDHTMPLREGRGGPDDQEKWVSWYEFVRMDDGTFEAQLDEAWYGGYGHNDGGTIRSEIPEGWSELPYDEFLERVAELAGASGFGFTADDLKEKKGLRKFFDFGDKNDEKKDPQ